MLNQLIWALLRHKHAMLALGILVLVAGVVTSLRMPVDIFPDLTAPTVTALTEAPGPAPEEVEVLVTLPLESSLNGAPGIRRVRSVSAAGISVIWAEFEWGQDVYLARQVVAERTQGIDLPSQAERPSLGPISSIMGEITFIALTSRDESITAMELRRLAETTALRSFLSIPAISQAVPIGGDVREIQVELDPSAMIQHRIAISEVAERIERALSNPAAGFQVTGGEEYLARGMG